MVGGSSGPAPPVSRGPFRRTTFVLAVTAFGAGMPTPLYAVYEQLYHFSSGVLVGIFAAYTAGVLATMLLVAPVSDRVGRKPVLALGMGLTALSGVAFIFASGAVSLAIARVISGLAVGATTGTATAAMTSLEPHRDPHHVARVSVAANFGGVASGILLCGFLVAYVPYATVLPFVILIVASLAGLVLVRGTPETVPTSGPRVLRRVQRLRVPSEIRAPFWVAASALAACYSVYGFFASLAPSFLRFDLGVGNPAASSAVVALLFADAAIIQIWLGQVRDRRALLDGLPIMCAGTLVILLAISLRSLPLLILGAGTLGLGVGFAYMGSVTLVDRVAPTALRGEILSAFFVVGYLALAVPTIGIGLAADQVGLDAAAFLFGAALAIVVGVLYLVTRRTPTPPGGEGRPRGAP